MDKNFLINKIKQKKELRGIADEVVEKTLYSFLAKNPKIEKKISESKNLENSSAVEECIKKVRAELRRVSGSFEIDNKDREILIEQNKISEILSTHSSTKERIEYYDLIYDKIFAITGTPDSVLDLGCGLNPLSFPLTEQFKKTIYYASDINKDNLKLVKRYFEKNNIRGRTFFYDLTKIAQDLPKAKVCFLFKVLDIIETKGHKLAEKIINLLRCKYIVVSFATKTLSGKKMEHFERGWIERMLNRLNLKWTKFEVENELFYVVEKNIFFPSE